MHKKFTLKVINMRNLVVFLIVIMASTYSFGTTYVPVSIKKQIVESDAIVKGEVISTNSEEAENGRFVTNVFIRADKWIGVNPSDNHLNVYIPGGQVGDVVQTVHGAPKFKTGEKVVLMLKEKNESHWVQNLAMGKFMIKRYGHSEVIINSVFPNLPKVGQMPLDNFYELVSSIKNKKFKERFKDKYEIEAQKATYAPSVNRGRAIASVKEEREEKLSIGWLLVLLGIMGGAFTFIRRKQNYN